MACSIFSPLVECEKISNTRICNLQIDFDQRTGSATVHCAGSDGARTNSNGWQIDSGALQPLRSSSGSLAIFAAIRRASSRVSRFAAARRPGSFSK